MWWSTTIVLCVLFMQYIVCILDMHYTTLKIHDIPTFYIFSQFHFPVTNYEFTNINCKNHIVYIKCILYIYNKIKNDKKKTWLFAELNMQSWVVMWHLAYCLILLSLLYCILKWAHYAVRSMLVCHCKHTKVNLCKIQCLHISTTFNNILIL